MAQLADDASELSTCCNTQAWLQALQEEQLELEQRVEGIDVGLLQCTRDEASKRVEECEAALAGGRVHITAAERVYNLEVAEQKLLDEKVQVGHSRLCAI